MLKITIIDDDLEFMDKLENVCLNYSLLHGMNFEIQKINPEKIMLDKIDITKVECDILFVDIEITNISGIELSGKIRENNKKIFICFVAKLSKYAVDSYAVHAFDYILKPITQERINVFFDDLFDYFILWEVNQVMKLKTTEGAVSLKLIDILYFEYLERSSSFKNRVVTVNLKNNKVYAVNQTVSILYENLDHKWFVMSHKSFIVNMGNIKLIQKDKIILCNDKDIPLSQKRRKNAKEIFQTFLSQKRLG